MKLLLVSSTFSGGGTFLEHASNDMVEFLANCPAGEVVFIPYAAPKHKLDEYVSHAQIFFESIGQKFRSLHTCENPKEYLEQATIKTIFVSGGNTFLLIKSLQDLDLLDIIKKRVEQGAGYSSASAGTNIACPTMQTTNDMPIVEPTGFKALGLVPFQINAHFVPGRLVKEMRGETREQRLEEFLDYNDTEVVGLPETTWIRGDESGLTLRGAGDAVIFANGKSTETWAVETKFPH